MCNCIKKTEQRIEAALQETNLNGIVTETELQNKGVVATNGDSLRVTLEFVGKLNVPTKSGKIRAKKIRVSIVLSKCPFCGVKYKDN